MPGMLRFVMAATLLIAVGYVGRPAGAVARCLDDAGDAGQIRAARTAIDAACRCFAYDGQPGRTQGSFSGCVRGVVEGRVAGALLRSECSGTLGQLYRRSVCGRVRGTVRRAGPPVPCVSLGRSGTVRCAIEPGLRCIDRGSFACFASTSCIDAADTNGDLRLAAPGDTGECTSGSSYTDNGDGTITDDQLGLVWERKGDEDAIQDWYTWGGAASVHVAMLNATSFAGHDDWRVPTITELQTLVRLGRSPAVAPEFDAGCVPGCTPATCSCTVAAGGYWSSTSLAEDPGFGWQMVGFGYLDWDSKLLNWYVRAVRGGR